MKFWNVGVVFCDGEGGGSGTGSEGGGSTGAAASTGGNTGGTASTATTQGTGTQGTGTTAAQPNAQSGAAAKQYTYGEDRSTWVPGHKVRAQTEEIRNLKAQIAERDRRVSALAGIKTPSPQEAEAAQLREQLFSIVPEFKDFLEKKDAIMRAAEFDFGSISSNEQRQWANTGRQALNLLTSELKAAYGGQDLSDRAKGHYQTAFIAHLAQNDALRERFENGDVEGVVREYVADLTEGVLSPFKRLAAAPSVDPRQSPARRLPRQGGGGVVGGQARTVKPADGDKFHSSAFEAFQRG